MRFQKCSHCKTGNIHTDSSITIDGVIYRRKECYACGSHFYFAERQASEEEWKKARSLYAKKKSIESGRRRENASRGILEAHKED